MTDWHFRRITAASSLLKSGKHKIPNIYTCLGLELTFGHWACFKQNSFQKYILKVCVNWKLFRWKRYILGITYQSIKAVKKLIKKSRNLSPSLEMIYLHLSLFKGRFHLQQHPTVFTTWYFNAVKRMIRFYYRKKQAEKLKS